MRAYEIKRTYTIRLDQSDLAEAEKACAARSVQLNLAALLAGASYAIDGGDQEGFIYLVRYDVIGCPGMNDWSWHNDPMDEDDVVAQVKYFGEDQSIMDGDVKLIDQN